MSRRRPEGFAFAPRPISPDVDGARALLTKRPIEDFLSIYPTIGTRRTYASAVRAYLGPVCGPQRRQGRRTCSPADDAARHEFLADGYLAAEHHVTVLVPAEYKDLKDGVSTRLQAHSGSLENVQLRGRVQDLVSRNATIVEAARVLREIGEHPRSRDAQLERE